MEKMEIFQGEASPLIVGNADKAELLIYGISIPENAKDFYSPVLDWIKSFEQSEYTQINAIIHLDYFNTSSSFMLLEIFKSLKNLKKSKKVKINWMYDIEDESLKEAGEEFRLLLGDIVEIIPFSDSKSNSA